MLWLPADGENKMTNDPRIEAVVHILSNFVAGRLARDVAAEIVAAIDAAWVRVEDCPEEWKDGRELLVYFFDDEFERPMQVPAFWDGDSEEWIDPFVADVITFDVTHVRLLPEGPK